MEGQGGGLPAPADLTVRTALSWGGLELKAAGVESPSLDASLFLAKVLGKSRAGLYAGFGDGLCEKDFLAFRQMIARRLDGDCAAYILGVKEFRALDFHVNPSVLVPRPDTETLVEAALERLAGEGMPRRALDLCTGSGAVAVSLKNEARHLEVWAADICPQALQTARDNAARLLPEGDGVSFFCGDLYEALLAMRALPAGQPPRFHLIVGNPPYIPCGEMEGLPAEVQKEPRIALDGGFDGLSIVSRIIEKAGDYLYPGGSLLLEADPRQMETIAAYLEECGFAEIRTYDDLSGRKRVIAGVRPG
ncbi:MAG: peptide chain release factor N(5)-glutamine methyltransferase [Spirochaetes bacterium]|nr:peptide chain release factor N(5)-glutamine methyltransferase [Spirochaetota bacterium]